MVGKIPDFFWNLGKKISGKFWKISGVSRQIPKKKLRKFPEHFKKKNSEFPHKVRKFSEFVRKKKSRKLPKKNSELPKNSEKKIKEISDSSFLGLGNRLNGDFY